MYAENYHRTNEPYLPRNAFVDAFNELQLNWAIDLNETDIEKAFQHFADLDKKLLTRGIQPQFSMEAKEKAKEYLLRLCR